MTLRYIFLLDVGAVFIDPLSSAVFRRVSASRCPHGQPDHIVAESLNEKPFVTCYAPKKEVVV